MAQKSMIQKFENTFLDLTTTKNQSWFAAMEGLPDEFIHAVMRECHDSRDAASMVNKAFIWRDRLLAEHPDLAQNPAQFAYALEYPEKYMADRSGGKQAAQMYLATKKEG